MTEFLHYSWLLTRSLSLGGLAVALAGVAIFGWHFVLINARAARIGNSGIPGKAWQGTGARFGLVLLAIGVSMQIVSFILATMLRAHLTLFR